MREIGSIIGLKVVSTAEGKSLGTVTGVLTDLAAGEMIGVIVGHGPAEKGIRAADLVAIGADAVLVETAQVAEHLSTMPDLLQRRQSLDQGPPEVITKDGRRLGSLARIYIDPETNQVIRFEVSGGKWKEFTEGLLSLPVVAGIVHGPDVVIVPAEILGESAGTGGLKASMLHLADTTRTGYQRAAQRAGGFYEEAGEAVRHGLAATRQQMKEVAEEVKETADKRPEEEEPPSEEPQQQGPEEE